MRQKFFLTPFAATGDRNSPPDNQQPDGSVSYASGFGPNYEADPAIDPNAKPVPREETNGIFHDLTEAVSALQREGVPEFISADNNGGTAFAYSRGAVVRWSASGDPPFTTYVSRVNSNTAVPSNTTNWAPLLFEAASGPDAIAGTSNSLIVTPAALKAALDAATFTVPDATTSIKGIQRNATNAEAQAGTLNNVTITASALSSALAAYSFNASQVGSGTLAVARIPNLPASQVTSGTFDPARIPAIDISAGQVTSGTLPVARGGTGQSSLTSGSYMRGNGTGGVTMRTPAQVRSDIGAASLGANTFTANQTVQGSVTASGGFQGSSKHVKIDEGECPYGLVELMLIPARRYRHRREYRDDEGRSSLGFFAEDLEGLFPEMVRDVDPDPSIKGLQSPKVVEHIQLLPVLVRAIQDQQEIIEKLAERVEQLEGASHG